jgi:hypothetical protein
MSLSLQALLMFLEFGLANHTFRKLSLKFIFIYQYLREVTTVSVTTITVPHELSTHTTKELGRDICSSPDNTPVNISACDFV